MVRIQTTFGDGIVCWPPFILFLLCESLKNKGLPEYKPDNTPASNYLVPVNDSCSEHIGQYELRPTQPPVRFQGALVPGSHPDQSDHWWGLICFFPVISLPVPVTGSLCPSGMRLSALLDLVRSRVLETRSLNGKSPVVVREVSFVVLHQAFPGMAVGDGGHNLRVEDDDHNHWEAWAFA